MCEFEMPTIKSGNFPTLHVVGQSIPEAHWKALYQVFSRGAEVRTEYDRKNQAGKFIDPAGRDARVLIEVKNPFAQPRYPAISHCEIGTYIAEIMGAKDFRVLEMDELKKALHGELESSLWPYSYHQRLFDHPDVDGGTVDQINLMLDRLAKSTISRRAVATTSVPNIDPFLKEDVPCLREMQLRCLRNNDGVLVANLNTTWRSRDLYKAWPDNLIAISFLHQWLADQLSQRLDEPVLVGSYADYSMSLHIYGQDMEAMIGNPEKGMAGFFETFPTAESYCQRALGSDMAAEMLVLPQLNELLSPRQMEQWQFPPKSVEIIRQIIDWIESGKFQA